jgi:signal transduction histidine kinase/CheY-like chemotaxis protein/HPt (histidine-containing phosphotransfer) domain-containing protein
VTAKKRAPAGKAKGKKNVAAKRTVSKRAPQKKTNAKIKKPVQRQDVAAAAKHVELLHQVAGICNRAVNFYDALRKASVEIAHKLGWPICIVYRLPHGNDQRLELSSLSLPKVPKFEALRPSLMGQSFALWEDLPGRAFAQRQIEWIDDVSRDASVRRFAPTDPVKIRSALAMPVIAEDHVVAVIELLSDQPSPRDEMVALILGQVSSELGRVHLRDQMTVALQEARAEAESSARAKASFLAAMSHEVRTPMNGVVGMVDLILQTKLDDDQRFMLLTVKDSGQALIKVINDILDFSKIEAGRLEIEEAEFSLPKLLEDVAMQLSPAAAQKSLNLITYIDPSLPDTVLGDAVRVRQILLNLGSNAVKFSDAGEVVLKADRVDSSDPESVRVLLSVRDQGMGIAPEARTRLFEEFQQADTSTTRRFGGTGLGLAICQRLTKLMGGDISVDSVVGVGSEFRCSLPFRIPDRKGEILAADLSGLHVLVVCESTELRRVCRQYLTYWKADVSELTQVRSIPGFFSAEKNKGLPDVVVIPQVSIPDDVAKARQDLISHGYQPFPRFVVARTAQSQLSSLQAVREFTFIDVSPVRRAALVSAVAIAAGRASPETPYLEQPEFVSDIPAPTVDAALATGTLILVAEDHVANREVIRRQLNRLGYACEMAEDGAIALKMWQSKTYALLLTDCHMPNMDGFGLTDAIRKLEKQSGRHSPIIAITANVLQGEAERCLAAGMDGFLPKPVDLKTLRAELSKWIKNDPQHVPAAVSNVAESRAVSRVLDLSRILEAFGEIDDSVREYFQIFIESVTPLLAQFEEEMAQGNHTGARETIHKAKGAAANAGATEMTSLMHEIEIALVEKRPSDAQDKSRGLEPAWERLQKAIAGV